MDFEKLGRYLKIISKESTRMEDIDLTIGNEGRKKVVDLDQMARERFLLNEEIIAQTQKKNIIAECLCAEEDLLVLCPLFGLERVITISSTTPSRLSPPKAAG